MVSPGELRLVASLTDEGAEFDPEIADSGAVSYPDAARPLDDADGDPVDVLERFAVRGVLENEFVSKVYVCPECSAEGMQYTTVCPACEAAHAVETRVLEHACGHVGPETEFKSAGDHRCPSCESTLQSEDVTEGVQYVCHECREVFDTPDDRLWCRDCLYMFPPEETTELVLYRYGLAPEGERWLDRHTTAREVIAESLRERRFETEVDTTVADDTGDARPIHVLATDDLMDDRRLVAIHETPDDETVDAFCAFAESVGAHPIVITTTGTVERGVGSRAETSELTLLSFGEDGSLGSDYEVVEDSQHRPSVFQRLSAAVDVPAWKSQ
jgi:hypothetical protein